MLHHDGLPLEGVTVHEHMGKAMTNLEAGDEHTSADDELIATQHCELQQGMRTHTSAC